MNPAKNYANSTIRLSPSSLSLFLECPKCFWLYKRKGARRPSLPLALHSNFDKIIKIYFDKFRERNEMPPEIKGRVEGKLFDNFELLEKWRNTLNPGLKYKHPEHNFELSGGIDDCLFDGEHYFVVDFKTTGSSNFHYNSERYYQHQMDIYNFLLEHNGYKTKNTAYLIYYKPKEVIAKGIVQFQTTVKKITTDNERAKDLFEKGIRLLLGPMPKRHSECEYCLWGEKVKELF